jgi:hypothetical protein
MEGQVDEKGLRSAKLNPSSDSLTFHSIHLLICLFIEKMNIDFELIAAE